jgi:hypothetical protein
VVGRRFVTVHRPSSAAPYGTTAGLEPPDPLAVSELPVSERRTGGESTLGTGHRSYDTARRAPFHGGRQLNPLRRLTPYSTNPLRQQTICIQPPQLSYELATPAGVSFQPDSEMLTNVSAGASAWNVIRTRVL